MKETMNRRATDDRFLLDIRSRRFYRRAGLLSFVAISLISIGSAQDIGKTGFLWHDPAKIKGASECGVCHVREFALWDTTAHARGRNVDEGYATAEKIKELMGVTSLRHESLCIRCHSTGVLDDEGRFVAASGVSCESCHGAGRDYIGVHNKYGTGATRVTETPAHKEERIQKSKEGGMLRPSEIYGVVANCFQCHTVPHEVLVNKGGHPSASADFDFLKRLEQIRHNFLEAQFDPNRTNNRKDSPERIRLLYVASHALDLEYSIRGAAVSKEAGGYIRAMQRKVRSAVNTMKGIGSRIKSDEINTMLTAVADANIAPNNEKALLAAAEKIAGATKQFLKTHDGSKLQVLDGVIAGTEPLIAASAEPEGETSSGEEGAPSPSTSAPAPSGKTSGSASTASSSNPYPKKQFLRPRSTHRTLGPGCDCHKEQNRWWEGDRHFRSAQPFLNKEAKNVQIARLYGLSSSQMTKGNNLCMDCHGTVVSGQEAADVFDGASCESCHGPGGDYKKPHSSDNPPNGYDVGKNFGMIVLEDVNARAAVCASCHYITDPRLLSTGHPSGKEYDIVQSNAKIKHWKKADPSAGALKGAFDKVKQQRGAVPAVERVTVAASGESPAAAGASSSRSTHVAAQIPRPVAIQAAPVAVQRKDINLEPLPQIADTLSIEEQLAIVKKRLDLLYREIRK
jgi:Cytochrome c554 and c-prime